MKYETITATAPSHWASALINGDYSGFSLDDDGGAEAERQIDDWLTWVDAGAPVDCVDAGFMRYHDAAQFGVLACDCMTYTFLRQKKC